MRRIKEELGKDLALKVAVFIDHHQNSRREVGGLAKTWENFSKAAGKVPELDLTVHFLGRSSKVFALSERVRFKTVRPAFSTERVGFLSEIPTHTDLALFNPYLFPKLNGYDVLHTTNVFHASARTVLWYSRWTRTPLVTSIQTDIIGSARLYTPLILQRALRSRRIYRLLMDRCRFLDRHQSAMGRKMDRYLRCCRRVFVSNQKDLERVCRSVGQERIRFLRRGIDKKIFHPSRRDRKRLEAQYGISPSAFVLTFVGRLEVAKNIMVVAKACKSLQQRGLPVHLLLAGEGAQRGEIQALLREWVTITGVVPQPLLGWLYASSDLLVFPSEIEVFPNVVVEAKACGLPAIMSAKVASGIIKQPGMDALLIEPINLENLCEAIEGLWRNQAQRLQIGRDAFNHIQREWPSWEEVLKEDLLACWKEVTQESPNSKFKFSKNLWCFV